MRWVLIPVVLFLGACVGSSEPRNPMKRKNSVAPVVSPATVAPIKSVLPSRCGTKVKPVKKSNGCLRESDKPKLKAKRVF